MFSLDRPNNGSVPHPKPESLSGSGFCFFPALYHTSQWKKSHILELSKVLKELSMRTVATEDRIVVVVADTCSCMANQSHQDFIIFLCDIWDQRPSQCVGGGF